MSGGQLFQLGQWVDHIYSMDRGGARAPDGLGPAQWVNGQLHALDNFLWQCMKIKVEKELRIKFSDLIV